MKKLLTPLIFLIFLLFASPVSAQDTEIEETISVDKTEYGGGESVTVTLSNLESGKCYGVVVQKIIGNDVKEISGKSQDKNCKDKDYIYASSDDWGEGTSFDITSLEAGDYLIHLTTDLDKGFLGSLTSAILDNKVAKVVKLIARTELAIVTLGNSEIIKAGYEHLIKSDARIDPLSTASFTIIESISCLKCSPEFPYLDSYVKCDDSPDPICARVDTCSKVRIITRAMIDQDSKVFEAPTEELCPASSCTPGKGCNFEYPDAGTPPCIEGLDSKGNPVIVDMTWFEDGRVLENFKDEAKNKSESIVLCTKTNTAVGSIETRPAGLVRSLLGILLSISGMIALYFIIRSGYQLMTSRGNPEVIQAARERLTSAIVGLLFILFSLVILQVIGVDLLKIPGFGS